MPRLPCGKFSYVFKEMFGGRTWARTKDPLIKSQLLYQLSYASTRSRFRLKSRAVSIGFFGWQEGMSEISARAFMPVD